MKILLIGTVKLSYNVLKTLIKMDVSVVGVVTKKKSNFNSDFHDLTPYALKHNIPVCHFKLSNKPQYISFIKDLSPDLIYCFGWSHILPEEVISIPKIATIGFHPATLPSNKGRHPIVWALFLGLKETSSTFFIINSGIDTGNIISQKRITINIDDNADSLYNKIISIAIKQVKRFTSDFIQGNKIIEIEQDVNDGNIWRKRGINDGSIDFRMNSFAIYNLVRALTHPYVGAHINFENKEIKIWEVEINKDKLPDNVEPGKILSVNENRILVKTYDSSIFLVDHGFDELPKVGNYL